MKIAALLIGLFLMGAGVVGLIIVPSPRDVRAFLAEYTATPAGLYALAALRIGLGWCSSGPHEYHELLVRCAPSA